MKIYQVTVRTIEQTLQYFAIAPSASLAYRAAAETQGDTAYGITVLPA
jgi:hypothetical protein